MSSVTGGYICWIWGLTHWLPRKLHILKLKCNFQKQFPYQCPRISPTIIKCVPVDITYEKSTGGNGLVSSGNKPLSETMFTKRDTIILKLPCKASGARNILAMKLLTDVLVPGKVRSRQQPTYQLGHMDFFATHITLQPATDILRRKFGWSTTRWFLCHWQVCLLRVL